MKENPTPRLRWFQFSLRTLFFVTLLVGFGCAWVGMQLQEKRRHEAAVNEITKLKEGDSIYSLDAEESPAWKEWLFGLWAVKPVNLNLGFSDATDSLLTQTQGMNFISIDLEFTKVTDAGLLHLKGLTSLKHLSLWHTQITDTGLSHLKGLTSLTELYLSNTRITDAGLTHLEGLTNLKTLYLGNTQITDAGLYHLKGLISLDMLALDNTQVTDAGLTHLKGLTRLVYLDLENTQNTQAGVDTLQKAIPGCEIHYSSK